MALAKYICFIWGVILVFGPGSDADKVCDIAVESIDHKFGKRVLGRYFNFDRKKLPGLQRQTGDLTFQAINPRTGLNGEVRVWGRANGGSRGDAHGRFNKNPIYPGNNQWKVGDWVVPVAARYCTTGPPCQIPILSSDHRSRLHGQYFNFNKRLVKGIRTTGSMKFHALNLRTGQIGEVIVWGRTNGGSVGSAHGRFNSKPVKHGKWQWRRGDKLIPVDISKCRSV